MKDEYMIDGWMSENDTPSRHGWDGVVEVGRKRRVRLFLAERPAVNA